MHTKEKEIILKLLQLYKEMPYLWDKTHKDYRNKIIRTKGQRVLVEVFKGIEPNATIKTLNKKIQNLRTNYVKELRKVLDSNETRSGADDTYIPSLYYFNALSFLGTCGEPCDTTRNTLKTQVNISSDEETQSETQDFPPRKKNRLTQASLLEKQDTLMATAGELLHFKEKEEDWEVLGKSIGLQLRDLDKTKLRITQKIISDAIYYASTGALTHNSYVALGPPVTQDSSFGNSSSHHVSPHNHITTDPLSDIETKKETNTD